MPIDRTIIAALVLVCIGKPQETVSFATQDGGVVYTHVYGTGACEEPERELVSMIRIVNALGEKLFAHGRLSGGEERHLLRPNESSCAARSGRVRWNDG